MNILCRLFDHTWNYSASSEPSRSCYRCHLTELPVEPFDVACWQAAKKWEVA